MKELIIPALKRGFRPQDVQGVHPDYGKVYDGLTPERLLCAGVDELMMLAALAAQRTALDPQYYIGGVQGGPFGAAAAIPETLTSGEPFAQWLARQPEPQRADLKLADVARWQCVALGSNLVEPLQDPSLHGEGVLIRHACKAVGGRSLRKRFVLMATTGAPCGMCEGLCMWAGLRWVIGGAPLYLAVQDGFHECLPPDVVQQILSAPKGSLTPDGEPWVGRMRALGVEVVAGVLQDAIRENIYRPYFDGGGVLYDGSPNDAAG